MKSEQISDLAKALAKAQGEMSHAEKDSKNPHFKSSYASLASVWEACRGALTRNGLSVVQSFDETAQGLVLRSLLTHESGQWIESVYPIRPVKNDPQGFGSAATYARRYSLAALVGVVQDDDDANEASMKAPYAPERREVAPERASLREPKATPTPVPQPLKIEIKETPAASPGDFIPQAGKLKGKPLKERGEIELETYVLEIEDKLKESGKTVDEMSPSGRALYQAVVAELMARKVNTQTTFGDFNG